MPSIRVTQEVQASPERTFAVATDLARASQVVPAVRSIEFLTAGPLATGARFRETRVVLGREHTQVMEVLELDPPRAYTVGTELSGFRIESRFRFHPHPGGTRIELTIEGEPLNLAAVMAGALFGPKLRDLERECAADLAALAAEAALEPRSGA